MKHLAIPDDLFWVIRETSGAHGVIILLLEVGDRGKPISWKGVCLGMGQKGRESVAKRGNCGLLSREHMLKGGWHRQIQRGEC